MEEEKTVDLRQTIGETVVNTIENLDSLEVGSKEWDMAMKDVAELAESFRKFGKDLDDWAIAESDMHYKKEDIEMRKAELDSKQKELDFAKKKLILETTMTGIGILASLLACWKAWDTQEKSIINHPESGRAAKGLLDVFVKKTT